MSETILDVCNAVLTELNDPEWGAVGAVRAVAPEYTPAELETLRVTIVPLAEADEVATRAGSSFTDMDVQVLIQRRATADQLESLIQLAASIKARLLNRRLSDIGTAVSFLRIRTDPIIAADHFNKYGVFTSVVIVTYRTLRAPE